MVLLLDIDDKGKVTAVGVAEPANPPGLGFDEAAMVAAHQFEFEPAEVDGKPIAVQLTYRYRFKLKPKEPARARRPRAGRRRPRPRAGRRPPARRWSTSRACCASAAPACPCPACW